MDAPTSSTETIAEFAKRAVRAVHHARAEALAAGMSVVEISGESLVETFPDGTRRFIKAMPPPVRVTPGTVRLLA